jgi:methionyl-tRNA formyltransferase
MTADTGATEQRPQYRFALLMNGGHFACEVLQSLLKLQHPPELLILPEYPPAPEVTSPGREIVAPAPHRQLKQLAPAIEIGYAPAPLQAQCASLLRQHAIDFILVACWPYLIDALLIESAAKAALNMHPSMLPDYRGPDPIAAQLADKQARFGVSLHLLNQRFDRGDIVAQAELTETPPNPTRCWLELRCACLGSRLFIDALNGYDAGWRPLHQAD